MNIPSHRAFPAALRRFRTPLLALAWLALLAAACGPNLDAPVVRSDRPASTPRPQVAPTNTPALAAEQPTATFTAPASTAPAGNMYSYDLTLSTTNTYPISPYIYGVADPTGGDEDILRWLGASAARWGGNARTRHNWETNTSNTGADSKFVNYSQGDDKPGSASLSFLQRNARLGALSILTIPNIGWVAKDGGSRSQDVPTHGGPPVSPGSDTAYTQYKDDKWSVPYDPTANRNLTSVQSLPSKGAPFIYPPDLRDGKVYQDEWVAYLRGARPKDSLPTVYAMDNEPDLWADGTHVDVHPVRPGYDDMLSTFLAYARAVKKADPEGMVAGPESWGVTGYLYSAFDEGGDKFATAADRQAHGDTPFLEWFLKQVAAKDKEAAARSLDVLSLHYYPNAGQYEGGNDPKTQASRIQAPRALWDGLYVEDSWVAHTEWANLGLLRRVQKLVDDNYPGTKTAISEWNFGGEDDISGALATADALGIFGREGTYFATYWGLPRQGSPTGWAFRLYRNYDGNGASFGTRSVDAQGADPALASAYASLNDDGSRLTVMLINKDTGKSAEVVVKPRDFAAREGATVYRYSTANLNGIASQSLAVSDPTSIKVDLQPMSIALLVLDRK